MAKKKEQTADITLEAGSPLANHLAQYDDIRSTPTDEDLLVEKANAPKLDTSDLVKVKTNHVGGHMYDPEGDQWVSDKVQLLVRTGWLEDQEKAGKLTILD